MTKKLIVLALTAVLAVLGLFLCAKKARAEYLDSIGIIYRFPAEVVAVLPRENSVFVEDTTDGNQFSFEGIEDFRVGESVREQRRAEDIWAEKARKMLLEDERYEDKEYAWACALNHLAQMGKINYRMEHSALRPGSEPYPTAIVWD